MDNVPLPTVQPIDPDRSATSDPALVRRRFLRGGALLAAATGGAVVASAVPSATQTAAAADGDVLHVGAANEASSATSLTLVKNAAAPALTLTNAGGPALRLTPNLDAFGATLPVGGLASVPGGLLIGLEDDKGKPYTSYLVSAPDLARIPVTMPFGPGRVLSTKDERTLNAIVRSSPRALDSKNRLKDGAWIDVTLLPTSVDGELFGAFITLTSLGSKSSGSLAAGNPLYRPDKSVTLPFDKGRTVATGTLVETGVVGKDYCVRIRATATTHLKLDVNGFTIASSFGGTPSTVAGPDQSVRRAINHHLDALDARTRS